MENLIAEIIEKVLILDSDLETSEKLELITENVINKFLSFTNRTSLVDEDLDDPYEVAIPSEVRISLAEAVILQNGGGFTEVSSIKDHGQEIQYREGVALTTEGVWKRYILADLVSTKYEYSE